MRLRLSQRFNLYIGGILLLGILLTLFYDLESDDELFTELGAAEAERLSRVVFDQLYTSMRLGGGRSENRAVVERFRTMEGIEDVRIIHGLLLDKQYGIEYDELPVDDLDRKALEGTPSWVVDRSKGGRTARYVTPFFIKAECQRCHFGKLGDVSGAISIKISLKGYEEAFGKHTAGFLFWGGGILVAITIAVLLTVYNRLLLPLDRLRKAIEALASGDLGYRISIKTGDELEALANTLNDMAASFQKTTSTLKELNEKHESLLRMAVDAIILVDVETRRLVDANPAATILTGFRKEELLSMKDYGLCGAQKQDYEEVFRRLVYDGRGYLHDALIMHKDGQTTPAEIAASVLDLNGRKYLLEIWRDLSERRGFEDTFRKYVAGLEKTVKERTATLNKSLAELEEAYAKLKDSEQKLIQSAKLRSLGEMGAGIAHELNSPLAGILSITEVLLNRTPKEHPNHVLLERVRDAAVRSKYIILDVLTYARPSKGEYAPMYLNETIKATLLLFTSEIKTSSIEIEQDFDPELPKIPGNKGQIMEVMLNIIKNARDAMEGKGRISLSTRVVKTNEGDYAVAEVRDTGPGIPEEVKDKIFDPFFTTKQKGGGVNIGLGLSIAQSIVKEHGGRIEVESAVGKGALFRVYLPVLKEDAQAT